MTTAAEGAAGGALGGGSSSQVSGTDGGDLFADLAVGMQTLLSPDGKFNMDRKAALLQVTDYPDRLDKVGLYLDAVQTRASRQVQIQARVIEVELRDEFAAGIDWKAVIGSAGESVSVTQSLAPTASGGFREPRYQRFFRPREGVCHAGESQRRGEPARQCDEQ
jgi:type II secretory pathway component GspD/PulD (secretin)